MAQTIQESFLNNNDDDVDIEELEKILLEVEDEEDSVVKDQSYNSSKEASNIQNLLEIGKNDKSPNANNCNGKQLFEDLLFAKELDGQKNDSFKKVTTEIFGDNGDDIDSSDDEGIKNFLERKYNEYGEDINRKLKQQNREQKESKIAKDVNKSLMSREFSQALKDSLNKNESDTKKFSFPSQNQCNNKEKSSLSSDFKTKPTQKTDSSLVKSKQTIDSLNTTVFTDPIFGMRIINPLISSSTLLERMEGKKAVGMCSVSYHTQNGDLNQDWVIAGAIVNKSPVKTAKTGSLYSIWKISDLKGVIKTISLFLFKNAHKELWKIGLGMVIAILNPKVLDNKKGSDAACLSIDNAKAVMIIGQSKDLGFCKGRKKNGDICGAVVNISDCDVCIFHVQQEFGRMSKRSELQSATAGRGLNALRNKVLGKNEVFYGGQMYTAVPARKSAKLEAKDQKRLMSLTDYFKTDNSIKNFSTTDAVKKEVTYAPSKKFQSKIADTFVSTSKERLKDLERLKTLNSSQSSDNVTQANDNNKSQTISLVPEKFQNREFSLAKKIPKLSKESFSIELNIGTKKAEFAKLKALEVIKKKPIEKSDPNFVRYRGTESGKKRAITELNSKIETEQNNVKKRKLLDEENARKTRLQKIIEATSSHIELIESRENEEQEKYFNKMEKKEQLQEKMLNTYKVPCKAVICIKCKYTAFSAADRCKEEKHQIKVVDAEKRFFECQDCGNRTITVHKIPKLSCKNCQSSRWKRAPMIREKKVNDVTKNLSIRGNEEKFLGTLNSSANLNLLVPDEE